MGLTYSHRARRRLYPFDGKLVYLDASRSRMRLPVAWKTAFAPVDSEPTGVH